MFTGIVGGMGAFRGFREGRRALALEVPAFARSLRPGDSLAVDGACLTLTGTEGGCLLFDVSRETLERTRFGRLRPGDRLNLEAPLTPASMIGGHFVTGHVDGLGRVQAAVAREPGRRLRIGIPHELRYGFVPKGSVAVNGVSLTVAALEGLAFETELIPLTLEATNLGLVRAGDEVHLECDILGKYVYNWLSRNGPAGAP